MQKYRLESQQNFKNKGKIIMSKFIPLIESSQDFRGLVYEDDDEQNLYLKGVVLTVDTPNMNKRIYPSKVFEEALEKYSKIIEQKRAFGELDHPENNIHRLNPEKLSHIFESIKKIGNKWIAKAKILDTPSGNIVKGIVSAGGRIGMSLRALGETIERGKYRLVKSCHLITLGDLVLDPSSEEFQNPIFENAEYVYENKIFREVQKHRIPISTFTESFDSGPKVPPFKDWEAILREKI